MELSSATEGAEIRYSLASGDSDPGVTASTSMKYEKPIRLPADAGETIVWKIEAVAMKDDMKDSEVKTFTYTISVPEIPVETYRVTVNNGAGSGKYAEGETVTICADVTSSKAGNSNSIDDTVSGNVPQKMSVMLAEADSAKADGKDTDATDAATANAVREFQEWSRSVETTFVMPAEDAEI